jgi:hypothetical protein
MNSKKEGKTTKKDKVEVKIGRDAKNGEFISVEEARRRKSTAVVETIKRPSSKKKK